MFQRVYIISTYLAFLIFIALPLETNASLDIAFSTNSGQPEVICINDGYLNFECSELPLFSTKLGPTNGAVAEDFNNDGKIDIYFATGIASVPNKLCVGDGFGEFNCETVGQLTGSEKVDSADVNGDGNIDIVFGTFADKELCLGNGDGTFNCSNFDPDLTNIFTGVKLGDINNDAIVDAVFANSRNGNDESCLGDGTGLFSCVSIMINPIVASHRVLTLADFNNDGNLDAVFPGRETPQLAPLSLMCLGDGLGSFTYSEFETVPNLEAVSVDFSDFNNDGIWI